MARLRGMPAGVMATIGQEITGSSAEPRSIPVATSAERVMDDFSARVLDAVDEIPPGRVMSYKDIAACVGGGGPRQVGRVMSAYGGGVPWWRVVHADGTPAPGHESGALARYLEEGTPLRPGGVPVRVDMRRARWGG
jgi:alkylated DNA nucleotide flippase Atl1